MFINQEKLEKSSLLILIIIFLVVSAGGIIEVLPLFYIENDAKNVKSVRPYSPLELAGRNLYIREGCYNCHTQMVRTLREDVQRYGHYGLAEESMYDHPFQWGSKRTGPDLGRLGGRYSNYWHVIHMRDPRAVVPSSIMPGYPFLEKSVLDYADIKKHMLANRKINVPYTESMMVNSVKDLEIQAGMREEGIDEFLERYPNAAMGHFDENKSMISELDALIAYLQILGKMVDFDLLNQSNSDLSNGDKVESKKTDGQVIKMEK